MDAVWATPGDVIGLHVGEPSFPTDDHVLEGARRALDRRQTRYVPNAGIPELRRALAAKVGRVNGITADDDQIIVTVGGTEALFNSLALVVKPGDEVLIPDPGWPNFAMMVILLQGIPIRYQLTQDTNFQPDHLALEALVSDHSVAIIVNSPSNPLGTVMTQKAAADVLEVAHRHDLWIISDECYDEITFDIPQLSIATAIGSEDRVITCFSMSKTYAMTGLRVGYSVLPAAVADQAAKLQEPLIACVSAPAQWAALAALEGDQHGVVERRDIYRSRRDRAAALLGNLGVRFLRPDGAFYLWVDVTDRASDDVDAWALNLLHDRAVAVAPGTTFGPSGQGWCRVSLATDTDLLLEGCRRLASYGH